MTINDILNLDDITISKMSRQEIAKVTTKLGSAANKRVKRFEKKGIETPATRGLKNSGGKISVKNKNINELRKELYRAKKFLTSKTSTSAGYKQVQKDFEKRIGGKLTPTETKNFWKAYSKLSELEPHFVKERGSTQFQEYLRNEIVSNPNLSVDNLLENALNEINTLYKQITESDVDNIDEFFELGGDI